MIWFIVKNIKLFLFIFSFLCCMFFVSLYYKNIFLKKEISQLKALNNSYLNLQNINDKKLENDLKNNQIRQKEIEKINNDQILIKDEEIYFQLINQLYEKF